MRPCQRGTPAANSLQANAPANLLPHRIANRYAASRNGVQPNAQFNAENDTQKFEFW